MPTITVEARLIRYLRRGVRGELAAALREVRTYIEVAHNPIDTTSYRKALVRLDSARALLDAIGLSDAADVRDVEVDLEPWRGLVVKALAAQHELEVSRLEDAGRHGFPNVSKHDVNGLAELVAQLRRTMVVPVPRRADAGWPRRHRGAGP